MYSWFKRASDVELWFICNAANEKSESPITLLYELSWKGGGCMSKNVYIFGAGADKNAYGEMPLGNDFVVRIFANLD